MKVKKINLPIVLGLLLLVNCNNAFAQTNLIDTNHTQLQRITISAEPDYPPYCIIDKNGNPDGFAIDLFKAAAKAVNIDVVIKIGIWNQIKQDLAEGKIDALPFMGRTPEREPFFDFTLPYLSLHGAIFVKKGNSSISTLNDLKNKKLGVLLGDNAEEYARRVNLSNNIRTTNTFEEAFQMLNNNEVDAVIAQRVMGLNLLKLMKLNTITPLSFQLPDFRQDFCFAVQKGNIELLSRLNEGLSIIIANKTYDNIHLKWFGPSVKEQLTASEIIIIGFKIFIPLVIVLSLISIFLLRRILKFRTKRLLSEVAEHQKTNQLLHYQQLLLERMEKASKVGGWDYNVETKKVLWTNGVYDICGVSPIETDISSIDFGIKFFPHNDQAILKLAFRKAIEKGKSFDLGLRLITETGVQKWVWINGQVEFQNGKVVRLYGSITDVTESKVTEFALVESEKKIREIFNSTNEAILIHNALTGKINEINDRTLEIFGYDSRDEILIGNIGDISANEYPYTEDVAQEYIKKTINEGAQTFDWLSKKKNGETFWVEVSLRYVELGSQKLIIAVVRDVKERKKTENELLELKNELEQKVAERTKELDEQIQKLNKSQKAMLYMVEDLNSMTEDLKSERYKLEISNKELEAFSYSVSHDLRAPLRAVDGFSRMVIEDYSNIIDSEGLRLLGIVRENVQKMDKLIADLLALSRVSRTEMNLSKIDMTGMANSMFYEVVGNDNIEKVSISISALPEIYADTTLMRQVWQNLIGNALKYSKPKEKQIIEIYGKSENRNSVYYIKDNGVGFNPGYKHKIFDTFQRLHKAEEFEGTGIGLSIVKRIIARHGGQVWADSIEGEGATFWFSLPVKESV